LKNAGRDSNFTIVPPPIKLLNSLEIGEEMIKTGLLIAPARYLDFFAKFVQEVDSGDVKLLIADSIDNVARIFEEEKIDIVFLGASSEPEYRLEILQHILTVSPTTSVHCKGEGMDPYWFVSGILKELAG
jgi:hypothetical protein